MREIDELASELARHLTVFQTEVNHGIPAPVLASQAGIIARVSTRLQDLLNQHPDVAVTIDPRLNEGMEKAYLDALGLSTPVPDYPPEDL